MQRSCQLLTGQQKSITLAMAQDMQQGLPQKEATVCITKPCGPNLSSWPRPPTHLLLLLLLHFTPTALGPWRCLDPSLLDALGWLPQLCCLHLPPLPPPALSGVQLTHLLAQVVSLAPAPSDREGRTSCATNTSTRGQESGSRQMSGRLLGPGFAAKPCQNLKIPGGLRTKLHGPVANASSHPPLPNHSAAAPPAPPSSKPAPPTCACRTSWLPAAAPGTCRCVAAARTAGGS